MKSSRSEDRSVESPTSKSSELGRSGRDAMAATKPTRSSSISPPPSKRRRTATSGDRREDVVASNPDQIVIYTWNVNGISSFVQRTITSFFNQSSVSGSTLQDSPTPQSSLREVLRRYQWPTMLFLQEVKISPEDYATQRAVERAVQPSENEPRDSPSYKVFFCLPTDKYNARGFGRKVYGVCSIIRQDFVERCVDKVRPVVWDAEGRFLVCETKAVGRLPRLAIFNIYAVNGTEAPYKHSDTGHVVGTRHDRKLQVHKLLYAECRALEAQGVDVILAGDMNIARSTIDGHPNLRTFPKQHCLNRADFEAKFFGVKTDGESRGEGGVPSADGGLDLVDTYRHLHPKRTGYTYYPRGKPFGSSCDRVDMILISPSLRPKLVAASILETVADRGPSDHVPSYIHLDFGNDAIDANKYFEENDQKEQQRSLPIA